MAQNFVNSELSAWKKPKKPNKPNIKSKKKIIKLFLIKFKFYEFKPYSALTLKDIHSSSKSTF